MSVLPPALRPHVRLPAVAAVAAALALSACQDPAGVGLKLIDEEQADPSVRVVPLADLDTTAASAPAIGIAAANNALAQSRVLVGDVRDPAFGDASAVAYVDALQPAAARDLDAGEVRRVWLEMPRTYAYGDTTTVLPVELRAIEGEWEASTGYPADTAFAVGPALATASLAAADTVARLDLPEAWVRANAATLVGDGFADAFEGFAVQTAAGFAAAPGVVYGLDTFAQRGAGIRLVTAEADTLVFPLSEVFSSISTGPPAAPPAEILTVRRGAGAGVRFTADLGDIGAVPLARGVLRLPLDPSYAEDGPFVRPLAPLATLVGVREAAGEPDRRVRLGELGVTGGGDFAVLDTRALTAELQRVLADPTDGGFDRYEVVPPPAPLPNPASLDILPVLRTVPGADRPARFVLTLVGTPLPAGPPAE